MFRPHCALVEGRHCIRKKERAKESLASSLEILVVTTNHRMLQEN